MMTFLFIIILAVLFVTVTDILEIRHRRQKKFRAALVAFVILTSIPFPLTFLYPYTLNAYSPSQMLTYAFITALFIVLTFSKALFYIPYLALRRRRLGTIAGICLSLFVFCQFMYGIFVTPRDIEIRTAEISSPSLPMSFDGYRIALFSDIHLGTMIDPVGECRAVVDSINSQGVDMALFLGDIVNVCHNELTQDVMDVLHDLKAKDCVVAVQGNHDTGTYIRDSLAVFPCATADSVMSRLSHIGWKMLRDSTIYLSRGTDSVSVTGIGYTETLQEYKHVTRPPKKYDPRPVYHSVPEHLFNITVSHLPHLWPRIVSTPYGDVTFSGHVHACQISPVLFGRRISPASIIYDHWSGLYSESGKYLYVNDGIGCAGLRMRLGARPEVTIVRLNSSIATGNASH